MVIEMDELMSIRVGDKVRVIREWDPTDGRIGHFDGKEGVVSEIYDDDWYPFGVTFDRDDYTDLGDNDPWPVLIHSVERLGSSERAVEMSDQDFGVKVVAFLKERLANDVYDIDCLLEDLGLEKYNTPKTEMLVTIRLSADDLLRWDIPSGITYGALGRLLDNDVPLQGKIIEITLQNEEG